MKPESAYTWRESATNILTVALPFLFIILMGTFRSWLGLNHQPLYILLENPMLLMLSSLFAYVGAELGRRLLIKDSDPRVHTRIRSTATGVTLTLGVLAIVHLFVNGGVVNPK
jgi:hypothetical protein